MSNTITVLGIFYLSITASCCYGILPSATGKLAADPTMTKVRCDPTLNKFKQHER